MNKAWLKQHKFQIHLLSFGVMILAPIPMYLAAENGANGIAWALIGVFGLANLLVAAVG